MTAYIKELYLHRELLWMWTLRDIKVRYKQSVLGALWAVLQPLALVVMFSIVFSFFVRLPSDGVPYPIFAYTALLSWTFLAGAVSFGIPALVNNMNLVTKIYFPREILPLACVGGAFADFLVAGAVFVGALVWYQVPFAWTLLWVPLLVVLQVLLIIGIVLPAAALNVFYRDVRFVVPLAIQLWLYATPVIYPLSMVPEHLRLVYALNPMVGITESLRRVILLGQPPIPEYLAISAVVSLALAIGGYAYFKHAEPVFADFI